MYCLERIKLIGKMFNIHTLDSKQLLKIVTELEGFQPNLSQGTSDSCLIYNMKIHK